MTDQVSPTGEESERVRVVRDPPPPPGYVDPLESSPLLEGDALPGPQVHEEPPAEPRSPTPP